MLTLNDGRSELWQWDTGRKLDVDTDCSQVHFSNKVFGRSIDVDVVDGVAEIPDVLLQVDKDLFAWAFVGTAENGYTKISKVFKVNKRNKPADYVFTPPEQTTLGELIERLDKIEESQDPDAIKNAVDDYLANNPPASGGESLTVTLDGDKASHSASEIVAAVDEGRCVTLEWDGIRLPFFGMMDGTAVFSVVASADGTAVSLQITVAEDKSCTFAMNPVGGADTTKVNITYADEVCTADMTAAEIRAVLSDGGTVVGVLNGVYVLQLCAASDYSVAFSGIYERDFFQVEITDNAVKLTQTYIPSHPVTSVNGKTGVVELTAEDVGAGRADQIPTVADLTGTVATFRNSAGIALFTLDLSGLGGSATVYGNLVLSVEELTIMEGQSGTFTVALDKAPTASQPVYLAVSDGSRLSVSPATLTFTPDNWETPQTVTVTSLEDDDEEDNAITVNLTSTAVDARQVAVAITDNDVQLEIVTDGLILNMDYTGHVGDESDTIVDLASGLSFKNFSQFAKQETGINSPSNTYKYLDVVANDEKTAFLAKIKETGGFTLESFGTRLLPCFFLPNYKAVLDSGNAGGWGSTETVPVAAQSQVTRILQDDTTDQTKIGGDGWLYTFGKLPYPMNNYNVNTLFPYIEEFKHVVMTFSADGHADCFVNGVKSDAPVAVENFKAWDFDTMFGGQWSLLNNNNTVGVTTVQRIYNRVLTAEEVQQNMKANAKKLGLTTF